MVIALLTPFAAFWVPEALGGSGVVAERFARIEGVASREPYVPDNPYDPRNRRMSITLAWSAGGADALAPGGPAGGEGDRRMFDGPAPTELAHAGR